MDSRTGTPSADELLAHAAFVRWLAYDLVRDPHVADDVAQETFVRALERPPAILTSVRAWLAGVVRNVVRMRRRAEARRSRREAAVAPKEGTPSSADSAAAMEVLRRLTAAVAGVGEPYRATLLLRYYEGLMPSAIAERTGVPVKTVKTRLNRALALLRSRLDEEHGNRRAWALVLLPFAKKGPAGLAPIASGAILMTLKTKIGLAVAATAIALTAVILSLPEGTVPPSPPAPTAAAPAAAAPPPPPSSATADAGKPAQPASPDGAPAADATRGTVLVAVVDAVTGSPVAGVAIHRLDPTDAGILDLGDGDEISLFISEALEGKLWDSRSFSDAEGRTTLVAAPGPSILVVRHPRYRDWIGERFPLGGGEERSVEVRLVPYPEGEREIVFAGVVTDGASGWPLGDVSVTASFLDGADPASLAVRTGADGRYALRLPANALAHLRFEKEGYEPNDLPVNPVQSPWIPADVALLATGGGPKRGEGRLAGRITDSATGEPVPGAKLSLDRSIGGWGGWESAADGTFRIDLEPVDGTEEEVRLVVRAAGYATFTSDPLPLAPDRTLEIPVALARQEESSGLRGRVVDAADGAPLRGARVVAEDVFGDPLGDAVTDGEGRFALPVQGEEARIRARAEGYAPAAVEIEEGAALLLSLKRAEARIAGTVRDVATGTPLSGVAVALFEAPEWSGPGPSTVTGEDGGFAFDVAPGRYVAQARLEGYRTGYGRPVEAEAKKEARSDIRLAAEDCVLRGRVRDAATGEDLPQGADAILPLRVAADESEEFECGMSSYHPLPEVEVEGAAYSVRLAPGRYEIVVSIPGYAAFSRVVDLAAGESREVEIALTR